MFAHVVTAQAEAEGFDGLTRFVREQLPGIPQRPEFCGFSFSATPSPTSS
jgi:hypothetical protein